MGIFNKMIESSALLQICIAFSPPQTGKDELIQIQNVLPFECILYDTVVYEPIDEYSDKLSVCFGSLVAKLRVALLLCF